MLRDELHELRSPTGIATGKPQRLPNIAAAIQVGGRRKYVGNIDA